MHVYGTPLMCKALCFLFMHLSVTLEASMGPKSQLMTLRFTGAQQLAGVQI